MLKSLLKIHLYGIILLFPFLTTAQQKVTINGYIEDAESGEKLIAANIFDSKSLSGTVCNTYGFYSLTLPSDSVFLTVSYVGYQKESLRLFLKKDTTINFKLSESVKLKEVEIVAQKQANKIEEEVQMSRIEIPIEQIKRIPSLLGEVDVLKSLQLLPGVQSGGEGQNGIYVRGGSPDQNLILLDGVPVYNVSHLLGFFSVFNADAIKNVTLTKGGFPARYGGRLSSVVDINMKEGNMEKYKGEGSIGLVSSKLTFEGPIIKNKASFIISGRRTYVDVLAKPFIKIATRAEGTEIDPTLYFYDLNAKVNYKINEKHRIYLSSYFGDDIFEIDVKDDLNSNNPDDYSKVTGGTNWGNRTVAFRWNWMLNNKLFSNLTATYSKYQFNFVSSFEEKIDTSFSSFGAKYVSGIDDLALRWDFDYVPNPHHFVRFGAGATRHAYNPGAFQIKAQFDDFGLDTLLGSQKLYSVEPFAYIEDEISYGAFKANIGLHATSFIVNNEVYKSLQPRLGLNYLLSNNLALKASFCTMAQYINLLTNESISLPTDLWVPSTDKVKPQQAWQAALGVARTFKDAFEVSVEAYYKEMTNVLSYKEGADFIGLENDWQDKVTQGNGTAYGIEFFVQKKVGKFAGWVGYTWSKNLRQFEEINQGKVFPFKYDRRHDFKMTASYEFTPKIVASASWVYGTGNAITLPISSYTSPVVNNYYYGGNSNNFYINEVNTIGSKNDFRMAAYHRLDVGVDFIKKKRWGERKITVGAYNAYSRNNPYFIYRTSEYNFQTNTYNNVYKQVSLFPIIPSVSYSFKF